MEKIVSQLDAGGYFVAPVVADESPLEPGSFLIPGGAVDVLPPVVPEGSRARWIGSAFVFEPIPAEESAEPLTPAEPTAEQIDAAVTAARAAAYRNESDPLFFKVQRGEATMDEWLAKIDEIRSRHPDGVWPEKGL